jgi:hypothetical protein
MSFGIPIAYNQLENNLAIPSQLVGDDLKSFGKGARNNVRSVPTSSGNVGPSSTLLFNLPVGGYDYIKSNSMYLKCSVTISASRGNDTNPSSVRFAGGVEAVNGTSLFNQGGASSLINRVNVMVGGTSLNYPQYNHFRNSVLPHILGNDYIFNDLRQMEYAGIAIEGGTVANTPFTRTVNVAIPLWLPCFNSNQAFPALLISTPITIEILTETFAAALSQHNCTITGYEIRDASLIYETITVSSEFKQALLQSKAGQMYSIKLNDWMCVGPSAYTGSLTYQIGCGLSSLRAVLWTEQLVADVAAANIKKYLSNGLLDYKVYVNNLQISVNNPDNDAVAFAEMNRALSRLNDYNITSAMLPVANTLTTGVKNTYTSHNWLGGASCDVFSDYGYEQTGVPASTVTVELTKGLPNAYKWQNATVVDNAGANLYVFLLHDSTLSVDVFSGVVMVRK